MKKGTRTERKMCMECGAREWCCVSLLTGRLRCCVCWARYYLRKTAAAA